MFVPHKARLIYMLRCPDPTQPDLHALPLARPHPA